MNCFPCKKNRANRGEYQVLEHHPRKKMEKSHGQLKTVFVSDKYTVPPVVNRDIYFDKVFSQQQHNCVFKAVREGVCRFKSATGCLLGCVTASDCEED